MSAADRLRGSCPVSAHVCRETARERDELAAEVVNLRNHVRALTEDVARADTLATILDGAREGLARSGSRAKGVRDVQALLTASAVREGVEGARRRVLSTRRREDRGRAASNALGLLRERDAARAEVERLRAGVEALAVSGARGIDLTPTTTGYVSPQWVYDYLATLDSAWRDRVRRLLDGECQEKPIKEESESQPRPMPEFSPERARLLAERPAHPWTPPDGLLNPTEGEDHE